jgi:hypothetical protein
LGGVQNDSGVKWSVGKYIGYKEIIAADLEIRHGGVKE